LNYKFQDGAIIATGPFYQKNHYDLANHKIMCRLDGCGNISQYSIANRNPVFQPDSFYRNIMINGLKLPANTEKKATVFGKKQVIEYWLEGYNIKDTVFIDEMTNAIFIQVEVEACNPNLLSGGGNIQDEQGYLSINFGFLLDPSNPHLEIACSEDLILKEVEGFGYHYKLSNPIAGRQKSMLRFVMSGGGERETAVCIDAADVKALTAKDLLEQFDRYFDAMNRYNERLIERMPKSDAFRQALYVSSLNCALSAYKDIDGFKGFFAGTSYQTPARTYYRDGYYTCLPLLSLYPELAREQIINLSYGINERGECPSGVKVGHAPFWENHLDSPQYYSILVHDYIMTAHDYSVLDEKIGTGDTVLSLMIRINDALLSKVDGNYLLVREEYNRHDWADNVYRCGYVTYIEALLYQSLYGLGRILALSGRDGSRYSTACELVKRGINTQLWDEDRGYYINYKSENYLEDNLSLDTVLTVLYGIADETRSIRVLKNMENFLETRNNTKQVFGDWGVMCVYPFYRYKQHLVEKSSFDYVYHNGSDWPYLSCLYAYAKKKYHLEYEYPLTRWFEYGLEQGWLTPVEYYNPVTGRGGLLQGWSSMALVALLE
jgi:hypothetical protein